jgi:hypothetical protein
MAFPIFVYLMFCVTVGEFGGMLAGSYAKKHLKVEKKSEA